MNIHDALRHADPARQPGPARLEARDKHLLQEILATDRSSPHPGHARAETATRPASIVRDRRAALATVIVAVAVLTGTLLAVRAVPAAIAPGRAATPSTTDSLAAALGVRLIEAAGDRAAVENTPSLTWTEAGHGADDSPIELDGKTLFIAAACEGGGSIAVQISGRADIDLGCSTLSALGPIPLTDRSGVTARTVSLDVVRTSGHPRYIAKMIAVADPASTPACEPDSLAAVASPMEGAAGTDHGTITLTNNGTSTCTITGQPTAFLTDGAGGKRIGAPSATEPTTPGELTATVVLAPHDQATMKVAIVDIAGFADGDGAYRPACGRADRGAGWSLTWTGTTERKYVPLAAGTRDLCSAPAAQTSNIGPLSGPLVGQTAP